MSNLAIRVENLKKRYYVKSVTRGAKHDGLRHLIQHTATAPFRKAKSLWQSKATSNEAKPESPDSFWAINDLSFDVKQGDVVGLIGRNGAGKSTLLKLLSRITTPTSGRIGINGRISSLLEVGTGFHPELTGRENIYLNGAILGMKRAEVKRKFDEIVDFSGIEKFIDTPVKRYSSGMYVRLAFAVAAHLESEILVIDEVLAVGDAEFQKKCLGKTKNLASDGRTVLFVSHNMGMISNLCKRVLFLSKGQLEADLPTEEGVLSYYTKGKSSPYQVSYIDDPSPPSAWGITLREASIESPSGEKVGYVDLAEPFRIGVSYTLDQDFSKAPYPRILIKDSLGQDVLTSSPRGHSTQSSTAGVYDTYCEVPGSLLNNGIFFISVEMIHTELGQDPVIQQWDILCVNVIENLDEHLHTDRNGFGGAILGSVRPNLQWGIQKRDL